MRYLPLSDTDRSAMLATIGASSIDDLFVDVPEEARLDGPIHGLAMHASEMDVERQLGAMARKNMVAGEVPFFLGCGAYKHHVPASVDHLIQRGEFLTAYTPYQPEIAQGTLQVLFEFQTQVARLLGCQVANASMVSLKCQNHAPGVLSTNPFHSAEGTADLFRISNVSRGNSHSTYVVIPF